MITLVRVPDSYKDIDFVAGLKVGEAINEAGWELKDNEEVRINGQPVNGEGMNTRLRDGDAVVIVKNISGN